MVVRLPLRSSQPRTSGSSSKAMKLLGLSKLPPDASRSEHLMLMQQHRSLRKERAMSGSPSGLRRGGSLSRLGSPGLTNRSIGSSMLDVGNGGPSMVSGRIGAGMHEQSAGEGFGGMEDDEEGGMMHHHHHGQHHRHQTSEWLDMRESSLKLTPTDLDEQFLKAVTDLMNQFPEPPNPDTAANAITDLSSPATLVSIGRNRGDPNGKRGKMPRASSQRRGFPGGSSNMMGASGEVVHSKQNPMFQQAIEPGRRSGPVREIDLPVRISYSKPEDMFSL